LECIHISHLVWYDWINSVVLSLDKSVQDIFDLRQHSHKVFYFKDGGFMTEKIELEVVNPHCAGIDVGSRSHFVAIGQDISDVREFGVYADDLTAICLWLKENGINSVAMESTGSYWQNLYVELSKHGFDLVLANGKFTKNAKGKKTDVKDSRWIQKLHALGLLTSSFLPDETTEQLRTYCRQRTNWLQMAAEASSKMQKYLKLLNFRLDVVVKDICGLTGLAIIQDICQGNLDPQKLAEHRNHNCKKSKEEIAKALKGNNRKDYLFGLKQEYESYLFFQTKISDCDKQIDDFMRTLIGADPIKKNYKLQRKNTSE
jgi:transposase